MDQLPRLGKRELICLLLFTCNYEVSVWRGFLFLRVLGMGYVISLWHSLSLPYNYFARMFQLGSSAFVLLIVDVDEPSVWIYTTINCGAYITSPHVITCLVKSQYKN